MKTKRTKTSGAARAIGQLLAAERKRRGLSVEEFVELSSIPKSTCTKLESGATLGQGALNKYLDALGMFLKTEGSLLKLEYL